LQDGPSLTGTSSPDEDFSEPFEEQLNDLM
jgi:hypothetical protein